MASQLGSAALAEPGALVVHGALSWRSQALAEAAASAAALAEPGAEGADGWNMYGPTFRLFALGAGIFRPVRTVRTYPWSLPWRKSCACTRFASIDGAIFRT